MPRMNRVAVGGIPYHVINRSNGRVKIFHSEKEYLHFGSLHLYTGDTLLASLHTANGTTTTTYIHPDHLGSTNVTTKDTGVLTNYYTYTPYGSHHIATTTASSTYTEPNQYIGQDHDPESTLSYLNARYYDSGRGQFTSQDPVFWEINQTPDGIRVLTNPQTLNSYSYAGNNPVVYKDASGRLYGEASVGGDIGFFNASLGLRIDGQGVELFVSAGPSFGVSFPAQASLSSGNLTHVRQTTVSRSAEFMFGPGVGISEEGEFDSNKPLSNSKNKAVTYSVSAGLGAGVSQRYTISVPVLNFDSISNNQSSAKNTSQTSSYVQNSSSIGYKDAYRALNDARKALERGDLNGAKVALARANSSLYKQNEKKK